MEHALFIFRSANTATVEQQPYQPKPQAHYHDKTTIIIRCDVSHLAGIVPGCANAEDVLQSGDSPPLTFFEGVRDIRSEH